jgi:hypothetical protein
LLDFFIPLSSHAIAMNEKAMGRLVVRGQKFHATAAKAAE